jgi:hypothetical protein
MTETAEILSDVDYPAELDAVPCLACDEPQFDSNE